MGRIDHENYGQLSTATLDQSPGGAPSMSVDELSASDLEALTEAPGRRRRRYTSAAHMARAYEWLWIKMCGNSAFDPTSASVDTSLGDYDPYAGLSDLRLIEQVLSRTHEKDGDQRCAAWSLVVIHRASRRAVAKHGEAEPLAVSMLRAELSAKYHADLEDNLTDYIDRARLEQLQRLLDAVGTASHESVRQWVGRVGATIENQLKRRGLLVGGVVRDDDDKSRGIRPSSARRPVGRKGQ